MNGLTSLDYARAAILAVCELFEINPRNPVVFTLDDLDMDRFLPPEHGSVNPYQIGALGALVTLGFLKEKRLASLPVKPEFVAQRASLVHLRSMALRLKPQDAAQIRSGRARGKNGKRGRNQYSYDLRPDEWSSALEMNLTPKQKWLIRFFRRSENRLIRNAELRTFKSNRDIWTFVTDLNQRLKELESPYLVQIFGNVVNRSYRFSMLRR
jgi:hypothetical protein